MNQSTPQHSPSTSKRSRRCSGNSRLAISRLAISRRAIALPLLIAGIVAVPASAMAATPHHQPVKRTTFKYTVPVNRMALAKGSSVVASGTVTWPQSNVKEWWSAATIKHVVRAGVNNGRQSPYATDGFRCAPTINGEKTNFVCKLQGADVPTTVTLRYSLIYRGDTASG